MSLPESIQALVTKKFGDDFGVEVQTIPFGSTFKIKSLAPNDIVVKIKTIGLNPTDWKLTIGPMGKIVGPGKVVRHDAAGDVVRVGSKVTHLKVGDRVACFQFGCYHSDTGSFAEYSRFDSAMVFKLPDNLSYEAAAALPIPNYTAMQAFYGRLKFSIPSNGTANDCILIWGASTACGHQAVQFARLAGLQDKHNITVLTAVTLLTIANLEERPLARITRTPDIVSKLKAAAGGNPIGFAIDCVGTDGSSDRVDVASESAEAKAKEENIKVEMIYAGTLFGEEVSQYGLTFAAIPEDRVLISRWTEKELPILLESGVLKAPKLRVMPGGLREVLQGFEVMKNGAYSAEKLIYSL
ncbi:chaperonin 10-like protein [Mucidula mucida]|nr:chaperonin 10-like protein [Mucidula mucida]